MRFKKKNSGRKPKGKQTKVRKTVHIEPYLLRRVEESHGRLQAWFDDNIYKGDLNEAWEKFSHRFN